MRFSAVLGAVFHTRRLRETSCSPVPPSLIVDTCSCCPTQGESQSCGYWSWPCQRRDTGTVRGMQAGQHPRLAEVYPGLVTEIAAALRTNQRDDALAQAVEELHFYGWCDTNCLMTAPPGSATPLVAELEHDGQPVFLLSLDPTAATVTHVEILDGRDLGQAGTLRGR
jgi:hypothetical protein